METILRLLAENPESLGEVVKTYIISCNSGENQEEYV